VPPPSYGEEGTLIPPQFPLIKSREGQIADLKRSAGTAKQVVDKQAKGGLFGGVFGSSAEKEKDNGDDDAAVERPYDLLVIGGGATGSGIALDAATRGLKVALVERDDFSSGTSSKSTKLVHGGVRYLEKAVWELDYNQYAFPPLIIAMKLGWLMFGKIQTCEGGVAGTEILLGYGATLVDVVAYYAADSALVAGALLLGWDEVLRPVGWIGGYWKLLLPDQKQGVGCIPYAEEKQSFWCFGVLR
jgi:hypothetical protein